MKKFFLFFSILGLAATTNAQTPLKKSTSIVHKITGIKCYYCGDWGWELAEDLIQATEGKALYMGVFVPFGGSNIYSNPTSQAFNSAWASPGWGGIPDFGVNGIGLTSGSANTSVFTTPVNAFAATEPLASPANKMVISGNTVTVTAKAQFWAATTGEYYLAAYLIENGAIKEQSGPIGQNGPVAHHGVLRGSMSTDKAFGEEMVNGAVTANQVFNKTFTFNITDTEWNKANLKVYTVIWKKNGSKYDFVNASETELGTSINNLVNTSSLSVFPNPVNDVLNINLEAVASGKITYNVTNILGQQMMTNVDASLKIGKNHQTLNTAKLASGMYILNIQTNEGNIQTKFVKK